MKENKTINPFGEENISVNLRDFNPNWYNKDTLVITGGEPPTEAENEFDHYNKNLDNMKEISNMNNEIKDIDPKDKRYAQGLLDMMGTIAQEMIELGKFEAQRRMIDTPQDILDIVDKFNK